MMLSLEQLCYQNIATSVENAPPLIQEMIMGETTDIIEERVRGQIYQASRDEITQDISKKTILTTARVFEYLIPEIVQDIVRASVRGGVRKNYRELYDNVSSEIIEIAICSAETIAKSCVLDRLETGGGAWDIEYD